jgi:hypothetical protein
VIQLLDPPSCPPSSPWEVSCAGLIRRNYKVPGLATRALGVLDRFGSLRLSASSVGFDNDDVEWLKVSAVRTRPLTEVLTESALEHEADRIRKLLPPVPGRKWAVDRATGLLSELTRVALDRSAKEGLARVVVTEIDYRASFGRTKTLTAGLAVSAILGATPGANDVIVCMARRQSVSITDA